MLVIDNGDAIQGDASAATVVDFTVNGYVATVATQLADGQLAASIGNLYASGVNSTVVLSITLVNTDTSARTCNLYLTPSGGTARRIIPKDTSLGVGYSLATDGVKTYIFAPTGQLAYYYQDAAADDTTKGIATFEADDFDSASGKIDLAVSVTKASTTDSGTATPTAHDLNIVGGEGIDTSGAGAVVTIAGEAASTTNIGVVELATGAETNTGASATLAVTPDGLDDWTGSAQITTVGTLSAGDVTAQVSAASTTAQGKIEIATAAETTTGTDATRSVSPDGLAGSIFGEKIIYIKVLAHDTALTTGNGKTHITIPDALNGMNLVDADATVYTVSSSGTPTIAIYNATDSADMLSTNITIDANEKTSYTAATPPVVNGATDDVVTGDDIQVDVDVAGTGTKGLDVILTFALP